MGKFRTEEERKLDDTAKEVASLVVGIIPTMNEPALRGRLYNFFEAEAEYSRPLYDDANLYLPEEVVSILEGAFDPAAGDDDSMTVSSDFQWAFDQLSDSYRYRIQERFQHGVIRPHGSSERAQLYKAIYRLTDILNRWDRRRDYEGPGSRTVWSNARSREEIDRQSGFGDYDDPRGWSQDDF